MRAGLSWGEINKRLEEVPPGYSGKTQNTSKRTKSCWCQHKRVVSARTPCVGVAGTVANGGYSWLSEEYGCIFDPNLIDAEVVIGAECI